MDFLYLLEKIRNPVLNAIFETITHIGEETIFLVVAILVFWCVNKREGYFILITGLVGTVVNQALKMIFKIPRPWVIDGDFKWVGNANVEATGYSFPSGHTQNVAGTFGAIGRYNTKAWVRISAIVIIVLVAFSRMYLGVHTPLDVGVSLIIAAALVFGLYPFFKTEKAFNKSMPYITVASVLISVGLLLYVFLMNTKGVDTDNLLSARENAVTLFGATLALIPVYVLDRKVIKFETGGKWYAQIIKLVLGLAFVLGIKIGVKLISDHYAVRGLRYFLMVMFAGAVWPLTFGWFSKLRIGFLDRFTDFLKSKFSKNNNKKEKA